MVKPGYIVYWLDPDDDLSSGLYTVLAVYEESCLICNKYSEAEVPFTELYIPLVVKKV